MIEKIEFLGYKYRVSGFLKTFISLGDSPFANFVDERV